MCYVRTKQGNHAVESPPDASRTPPTCVNGDKDVATFLTRGGEGTGVPNRSFVHDRAIHGTVGHRCMNSVQVRHNCCSEMRGCCVNRVRNKGTDVGGGKEASIIRLVLTRQKLLSFSEELQMLTQPQLTATATLTTTAPQQHNPSGGKYDLLSPLPVVAVGNPYV